MEKAYFCISTDIMLRNNYKARIEIVVRLGALLFLCYYVGTFCNKIPAPEFISQPSKNSTMKLLIEPELKTHNWTEVKRILFWTKFFGGSFWFPASYNTDQRVMCSFNCHFTSNRQLLNSSDAVIFHGTDLATKSIPHGKKRKRVPSGFPEFRKNSQHWIFFLLESPVNTWNLKTFRKIFNLTMTYREDSDIYSPYGLFLNIPTTAKRSYDGKTKLIAWMVSHCETPNKRELFVKELQNFVPVDVYGACGNFSCNVTRDECYEQFGKTYKFYLALENSLCEDYATEKFFLPFKHNMVPIVYGGGNYAKLAPKGSYIDIESFNSTKDLAHYLTFLDENPEEYLKYFDWKNEYKVLDDSLALAYSWCNLCQQLVEGTLPNKPAEWDLWKWWNIKEDKLVCRQTPFHFK